MRWLVTVGLVTLGIAGCGTVTEGSRGDEELALAVDHPSEAAGAYGAELRAVEALIRPYRSFQAATDAGYTVQVTGCMANAGVGGMGFHFGNPAYIDEVAVALEPDVLLYEPTENGEKRLVGIEYIVPFALWTAPNPPSLFGQTFKANQTFQVWALHVWLVRHNPTGVFEDWNPKVDCQGHH